MVGDRLNHVKKHRKVLLLLLLFLLVWLIWGVTKAHAAITGTNQGGNDPFQKLLTAASDKLGLDTTAVNTFQLQTTPGGWNAPPAGTYVGGITYAQGIAYGMTPAAATAFANTYGSSTFVSLGQTWTEAQSNQAKLDAWNASVAADNATVSQITGSVTKIVGSAAK